MTTNTSTKSKRTVDHQEIRRWAEERDGHPARVKNTEEHPRKGRHGGILRIDFGVPEKNLDRIGWEEFFEVFDENDLAFLYQEETSGGDTSRFFKLVERNEDEEKEAAGQNEDDEDGDEDEEDEDEGGDAKLDEEGRHMIENVDVEVGEDEGFKDDDDDDDDDEDEEE